MKKFFALLLAGAMTLSLAACGAKEEAPASKPAASAPAASAPAATGGEVAGLTEAFAESPILVTSGGQSADYQMIGTVMGKIGMDYEINNLATSADLGAAKTLIVVVGGSSKGLGGSTGFTKEGEVARAEAFAAKTGIEIVLVQIGGADYRGELSDPMIKAIAPAAKVTMLLDTGNYDGLFTATCPANTVYAYTDEGNMVESLAYLFA